MNEPVELFLDCWRKVFSLKTLGGGYVRYFLLFSRSGLTKVETSHVGNLPSWERGALPDYMGSGDPASHIFWGAVFTLAEKILEKRVRREREYVESIRDRRMTVGDFLDSLEELCGVLKIRKAEVEEFIPYPLLDRVEVKREGRERLRLTLIKRGKKERYETRLESAEERERAIMVLQNLLGGQRLSVG